MKIIEVTDKNSKAILEYVNELATQLSNHQITVKVSHWKSAPFEKGDWYHFHFSNSTYKVIFPLLVTQGACVVTIHDVMPRKKFSKQFISPMLFWIINKKAKKIIVHSQHAKKLLHKNYPFVKQEKVIVIPLGCFPNISSESKKSSVRKILQIPQQSILFLYVGYIKKSKGIVETVKAFKKISDKNSLLYIVGKTTDNETSTFLSNIQESNIKYLGFQTNKMLNNMLIASDVIVNFRLDSVGETSASVVKALSMGKPVLATDIGSNKEVIGNAGMYCKPKVQSIIHVIATFIQNKTTKNNLFDEAKRKSAEYSWGMLEKKYIDMFIPS